MPFKDPQAEKDYQANYRELNRESRAAASVAWYHAKPPLDKARMNSKYVSEKWDKFFGWPIGTHKKLLSETINCALCNEPLGMEVRLRPTTDHDHTTGKFRGLLHQKCNIAIAFLDESEDFCIRAAAYLRKHSEFSQ